MRAEADAFSRLPAPPAGRHGAPGVRAHYHPNYYGAYVDPDGHNIEAVVTFRLTFFARSRCNLDF